MWGRVWIIFALCGLAIPGFGDSRRAWGSELQVTGSMSMGGRYDDNVLFTSSNRTASYITVVSPQLSLKNILPSLVSSLSYSGALEYHAPSTEFNNISHYLNGSLSKDWDPLLTTTLSDSFSLSPDSLQTGNKNGLQAGPNLGMTQSDSGLLLPRTTILTNSASIDGGYRWSRRASLHLFYNNGITQYDSANLTSDMSHRLSPSMSYDLMEGLTVNSSYEHSWTMPENGQVINMDQVKGGFSWEPFPKTDLTGSVGWIWYSQNSSGTSLSADASVSRSFSRANVDIRYTKGVSGTSGQAQGITLTESVSALLGYTFTERFSGSLSAAYYTNKSTLSDTVDARSYSAAGTLTQVLAEHAIGRVTYSYFVQNSSGTTGQSLTRNQVSVDLAISF